MVCTDADIELVATVNNGREAIEEIRDNRIDLVFLDIHMPGINGLEVLKLIPVNDMPLIIFTTAYDQYAITAFEAQALDYLLKPFGADRFASALKKAKKQIELRDHSILHQKMIRLYQDFEDSKSPRLTEFIIKDRGFEKVIKTSEILWIGSNSVYVELYTQSGESHLYRAALNSLENELPVNYFIRIHRSILVNKSYVDKVIYLSNNSYKFRMKNGQELISSRSYKQVIMDEFGT